MMFGLIIYIVTIMSLRFEVHGEMSADLVFSYLSNRVDKLAFETYSLKSSVAAINDRIYNIEKISNSPLHVNTYSAEVEDKRNEMDEREEKKPNDRIQKALAAEKIYVRNVLTDYERKLIEFQRAVSDQMNVMNTTIKASRENMGSQLEGNTSNINKSVHQLMTHSELKLNEFKREVSDKVNVMNTTIETSHETMEIQLEEITSNINKSVHQLMTHSELKLNEFNRAVSDQMNVMNTTIEASRENMGSQLEENTSNIHKSVHQLMTHSELKLNEFKREVSDQMNVMNTTIEASREIMGSQLEENTSSINKSVHQLMTHSELKLKEFKREVGDKMNVMNTTIEASREKMGSQLEENTSNINKSVHQLMTYSVKKFQDVIKEFESAMKNISVEHETTRLDLNEMQITVKDLENDINGGWSSWSSWSKCSTTCGEGKRSQSRACNNPVPLLKGKSCNDDSSRVDTCTIDPVCKYSDCSEIKLYEPNADDGVYVVVLWKTNRTIQVYCDMTTDGGVWTVFQNRYDGSVDFYRNYSQYVHGFGDLHTEFWLGLDFIQEMSSQTVNELRIDLMAANDTTAYEVLTSFSLSPPGYVLNVGKTISSKNIDLDLDRSWRFGPYHNGSAFSTYDHDVDSELSCAIDCHGAWWYNDCFAANLNGKYITPGTWDEHGMTYDSFNSINSLKKSKMSFRRI